MLAPKTPNNMFWLFHLGYKAFSAPYFVYKGSPTVPNYTDVTMQDVVFLGYGPPDTHVVLCLNLSLPPLSCLFKDNINSASENSAYQLYKRFKRRILKE